MYEGHFCWCDRAVFEASSLFQAEILWEATREQACPRNARCPARSSRQVSKEDPCIYEYGWKPHTCILLWETTNLPARAFTWTPAHHYTEMTLLVKTFSQHGPKQFSVWLPKQFPLFFLWLLLPGECLICFTRTAKLLYACTQQTWEGVCFACTPLGQDWKPLPQSCMRPTNTGHTLPVQGLSLAGPDLDIFYWVPSQWKFHTCWQNSAWKSSCRL